MCGLQLPENKRENELVSIPEMGIRTSMLEAAVMEPADRITPE
jgi:hypothetical protein